jgi:hypothetical protein
MFVVLFAFALAFALTAVFAFVFAAFVFAGAVFAGAALRFDMFVFALFAFTFVFSAGEHAIQMPATVSKARRARVLRIEFPPVPSEGSVLWSARGVCPRELKIKGSSYS